MMASRELDVNSAHRHFLLEITKGHSGIARVQALDVLLIATSEPRDEFNAVHRLDCVIK